MEDDVVVREILEKCKKLERAVLMNVDEFNKELLLLISSPRTTTTTTTIEMKLERARKGVQSLKRLVSDLESMTEDILNDDDDSLSLLANDTNTNIEKIRANVMERKFALKRVQTIFREAQARKQKIDTEEETKKREELLLRKQKRKQLRAGEIPDSEEASVQVAKDSTEALRRARQIMHRELEKGETTLMQMSESTNTMKKTNLEYDTHSGTLKDGTKLIQSLEKQARKERIVLWLGFFCFVTACMHVVLKRTPVLARFHPNVYFSNNKNYHHRRKSNKPAAAVDEDAQHSLENNSNNQEELKREEYAPSYPETTTASEKEQQQKVTDDEL